MEKGGVRQCSGAHIIACLLNINAGPFGVPLEFLVVIVVGKHPIPFRTRK